MRVHPVRFRLCTPAGRLLNADDPSFGISWLGGETTVYKTLQPGERFIGLGEKTGGLDRTGSAHTNWNSDVYAYPVDGRDNPLYATFPFYSEDGRQGKDLGHGWGRGRLLERDNARFEQSVGRGVTLLPGGYCGRSSTAAAL